MDIAITKMKTNGNIIIPEEMRRNIKEGEKLVIIKNKNQLILKKIQDISKNFEDDLIFAKKTEEAFKKYEKGDFIEMDFDDFMEEANKIIAL